MTIQKRELAFMQAHERFNRYIAGCDRGVSTEMNFEFVANLLMEFSDVASMALDTLRDFIPRDVSTLGLENTIENLNAVILRPQPERAMPEAVAYAEKHVLDAMSGDQYSPLKLREVLLTLYDRACDDQAQREADSRSPIRTVDGAEQLYAEKFPPTPGRFDTSFSGSHERAWRRENETRRMFRTEEIERTRPGEAGNCRG